MRIDRDAQRRQLAKCFSEARDTLLDLSRAHLQSEDEIDRTKADAFFDLAKKTDDLRRQIASAFDSRGSKQSPPTPSEARTARSQGSSRTPQTHSRKRKRGYPKYFRRGGDLVKVGLRRDRKTEYRHLVPAAEYQTILERLIEISQTNTEFSADDVLSQFDGPSYHAYIVLALLRDSEILQVPRRGTYTFADATRVSRDLDAILGQLDQERQR